MLSSEFASATGRATTLQVMVKDVTRYPESGGWGFGRFVDGKPVDEVQHQTCSACHAARVRERDFAVTRCVRRPSATPGPTIVSSRQRRSDRPMHYGAPAAGRCVAPVQRWVKAFDSKSAATKAMKDRTLAERCLRVG